jgi:hypothetical protein
MTTSLFPIDQALNDRLLLEAEQFKQDAIDFAVRRFAPQRLGFADVKVINLYSTNSTLRKEIRTLMGRKTIVVEHVLKESRHNQLHELKQDGAYLDLPVKADLVATRTALNKPIEWLAARLGAQAIVLPEAGDYLAARLDKQQILTIVGGDQAKL